jgi:hypothetical protein
VANDATDFAKLLQDAPMAPDANTVTLVGLLARTHDPEHFILTLTDGRSLKLGVNAVKAAKSLAGAIGQTVVELQLDAKHVHESLRTDQWIGGGIWPGGGHKLPITDKNPWEERVKPPSTDPPIGTVAEGIVYPGSGGDPSVAPFVAASPRQVHRATLDALAWYGGYGTRTYLTAYEWTSDHHTVLKAHTDQP